MAKAKQPTIFRFDLRKIGIILAIAVLFSIFSFSAIQAVYPSPQYDDYCKFTRSYEKPYSVAADPKSCPSIKEPSEQEVKGCIDAEGFIEYSYSANGCATSYTCQYCQRDYNKAREHYVFVSFILSSILGMVAIAVGLFLPAKNSSLNEWVGTGFMLGGLITLFVGTFMVFGELHRYLKPIVMLVELVLVIYLAYRKLGNK